MENKHYERMLVMTPDYAIVGNEALTESVEAGKSLVEKHGEDNLDDILTEDEMALVGSYLEYRLAIDDDNYE